jgi:hypothetical protein
VVPLRHIQAADLRLNLRVLAGEAPNPSSLNRNGPGLGLWGLEEMRYVVEVAARVDRDGASLDGIGHRVYESWTTADEIFAQLEYRILDGAPHLTRTGVELSVLAVRLYEADAESDNAAKELAAFGTAKLLSEITASGLRTAWA